MATLENLTTTPCGACGKVSTQEELMVACDGCDTWYHQRCVGATKKQLEAEVWYCEASACQSKNARKDGDRHDEPKSSFAHRLKALEREQREQEQELEAERILLEKKLEIQRVISERKLEMERVMSEKKIRMKKDIRAKELAQEREFKERWQKIRITKEREEMPDSDSECESLNSERSDFAMPREKLDIDEQEQVNCRLQNRTSTPHGLGQHQEESGFGITRAQLAARKSINRRLPSFSGKVEEWPLFIAAYEATNQACGFSDVENLIRLQEAIKGPALENVSGQLLLPKTVPKVISKLRQLYGRPEQLLYSLLEKVRRLDSPKAEKLESFIPFGNTVEQLCDHLEAASMIQHLNNPLLIQELVDKLPAGDKRGWIRYRNEKKDVTLRTLSDFLSQIVVEATEACVRIDPQPVVRSVTNMKIHGNPNGKKWNKEKGEVFKHDVREIPNANQFNKAKPCKMCNRTDHRLRYCQEFGELSYDDRVLFVEKFNLCIICLNEHGKAPCRFKIVCNVEGCNERHHRLLHPVGIMNAHSDVTGSIRFRMIPVTLYNGEKSIETLAFLDEGASVTLIEKSLTDQLGIKGVNQPLVLKWTADVTRCEADSRRVDLWVSGSGSVDKFPLRSAQTVSKLMLPKQALNAKDIANKYDYLTKLPISSYKYQYPGLLIGLNNLTAITPIEVAAGKAGEPIAVRSRLGWAIYGPTGGKKSDDSVIGFHQEVNNEVLYDLIKEQYALEECTAVPVQETKDEKRAREILEKTTIRVGDRFETGLLWKSENITFPDSYDMACKRLTQLEKKLQKNPKLYEKVHEQIKDYQRKGYAHLATSNELDQTNRQKCWYLPLNVVLNPKKPGKVRLVWDAAATVDGISLNSQLLKGPDLLTPLTAVICSFRERRIAFGGDIKEMYHQMLISKADKQMQRFLFRENLNEAEPSVYVMDVATFGASCSPCSAQYVKNLNASEFSETYPEAAAAIQKKHYVDDYFDSVDTVDEAINRAKQVRFVHSKGGFEIRNWVSNSAKVLEGLGERDRAENIVFKADKITENERVLGISWNPTQDVFTFNTEHREHLKPYFDGSQCPTKRRVLSCVMGFFDPLGLLAPFTIHGKMLMQDLWRTGCNWDDEIDNESLKKWQKWIGLLTQVAAIRIPRCYIGNSATTAIESLQLHIFTDASEQAYGCVAYLRVLTDSNVTCSLVMSRSKVAPLKRQSIPRLELMAAVLGSRLARVIKSQHSLPIKQQFFWTDSQTVISWIISDQLKYKQFVALRIGEIRENTNVQDWRWVPTNINVADVITKWGQGPPLESNGIWFEGPSFLRETEDKWPLKTFPQNTPEEMRACLLHHDATFTVINVHYTNRWIRLLRITATVVRFIENCRRKVGGRPILVSKAISNQESLKSAKLTSEESPLQQDELHRAEVILWKVAQHDGFSEELSVLNKLGDQANTKKIQKSSRVYKMCPELDTEGVMRVGGRLQQAEFASYDVKHPVILPKDHAVTNMIIQYYHEKCGHGNRETVLNELRQRYYIPKLRSAILKVVKACMWCRVRRCRPQTPMMAPLPIQRVTPRLRPFSYVGIDYFGPLEVLVGRRKEKRWVALFTCMVVRAVHLEVVHSLSTQACLMAIRRFICTYGTPDEIFSDNGTNFKGAQNELHKMKQIAYECAESISSPTVKWHFIPPGTPHMGGVWERMVKSVKEMMVAMEDGRKLTDEILFTSLTEAKDMINSRPLIYLPQDSAESEAITPNHFLRGSTKNMDLPVDDCADFADSLRNAYKRSQYLANQLWERWIKEYVPTLHTRAKWIEDSRPIQEGDLVFIVDSGHRKQWARGIVEEIFRGIDGRIRQVRVRTTKGIFKRAVANLAVIEI